MSFPYPGNEAWLAAICSGIAGLLLIFTLTGCKKSSFWRAISFGLAFGAITLFLWISKFLPNITVFSGNSDDSKLFLGLIAIIISTFTGFALKITFDQAQDARKIHDEMKEQMENFQMQVKRTERLAWIINEIAQGSAIAIHFPDMQPPNYIALPYLANLYQNPQNIRRIHDLSLDVFIARQEIRKIMNYDDRVYVYWLIEHFDSPIEPLKHEVRKQAAELHALLQDDQSQI